MITLHYTRKMGNLTEHILPHKFGGKVVFLENKEAARTLIQRWNDNARGTWTYSIKSICTHHKPPRSLNCYHDGPVRCWTEADTSGMS